MLVSSVMWIIYGKKCVIFSKSLLSGPTCKRWKQHRIFVCYVLSLSFLSRCFLSGGVFSRSGCVCQLVRRNQGKAKRNRIHVSAGSAGAGEINHASPARKKCEAFIYVSTAERRFIYRCGSSNKSDYQCVMFRNVSPLPNMTNKHDRQCVGKHSWTPTPNSTSPCPWTRMFHRQKRLLIDGYSPLKGCEVY